MSNILNTGAVLPSSLLSVQNTSAISAFNKVYNNVQLRAGSIIATYDIDNEHNVNKQTPEYDVLVLEQDKDNGTTPITYRNTISMDSFGGMADFFEFKRRAKTKEKTKDNIVNNNGQLVLLLCLDGNAKKGIIIGGIKQAQRLTKLASKAGLHLEGEYNGCNWKIDKEGAFILTFKGATDNEGKAKKQDVSGSTIKIEQDGSVELNTSKTDKPDKNESIRLDKTKQEVSITSRKNLTTSVGGDFTNAIKGSFSQNINKDLVQKIVGTATCNAKSLTITTVEALSITAKSTLQTYESGCIIKAQKIELNGETVAVGSGANALAVLGPQLLSWLASHTHPPIPPLVGGPVLPPTTPPPDSILSSTVMIKN